MTTMIADRPVIANPDAPAETWLADPAEILPAYVYVGIVVRDFLIARTDGTPPEVTFATAMPAGCWAADNDIPVPHEVWVALLERGYRLINPTGK